MADPREGVAADGTIVTGADRSRVPAPFETLLADAAALAGECGASLYVYGSVANGTVRPGLSDVDLLSVGLADPPGLGRVLSARYAQLCRGVEVSAATAADLAGDDDAAYGFRVFLRHYCVHLAGPDPSATFPAFPADARAARGFNGDIALHCQRWRQALESGTAGEDLLGVRAARKTLLAVAGLVSIRDQTWTTDRARAARRWGEIEPDLAVPLGALLSWATSERRPSSEEVQLALAGDGVVAAVVDRFASLIGLWRCDPQVQERAAFRRPNGGPPPPGNAAGLSQLFLGEADGRLAERAAPLAVAWSTRFERARPVREFPSYIGQRSFSGLWWSSACHTGDEPQERGMGPAAELSRLPL